ncbi:PIG-L family deacetylase [Marisediminicola senii]|uniref:PIG-L family deacetylase n=1 Tax=Marisediminicola senii TaxID=2711233 RepID=UPI0013ED3354|nr:PIG-L family deacetylase [Marisediminicola senii]
MHAHPDDETISSGGTIATLVDERSGVTVLTCTRGECGEVVPADLQHLVERQDALAAHREVELAAAMRALGVTDHRFLGEPSARMAGREPRRYRDSGMVWGEYGAEAPPSLQADSLAAADSGEVAADVATVIAATGATAVVSYNAYGGYGHPDHIAAHNAARTAARVMDVPFFAIEPDDLGGPDGSGGYESPDGVDRPGVDLVEYEVDVTPVLDRKILALRAHRSQLTVDGDTMVMSGGQVAPIASVERFRLIDETMDAASTPPPPGPGSAAVAIALSLVAGLAIGALGTVVHQVRVDLGVAVPLGVIGALFTVAALVVGLRVLTDGRLLPGAATVGLLAAVGILSLESAGGSVLIPQSTLGYVWLYGSVGIAFLALAWPKAVQPAEGTMKTSSASKGTTAP